MTKLLLSLLCISCFAAEVCTVSIQSNYPVAVNFNGTELLCICGKLPNHIQVIDGVMQARCNECCATEFSLEAAIKEIEENK
jgi:hypothetical protein